jgi:rubrerythrin
MTKVTGAGREKMVDSKKSLCNPTPQYPSLKTQNDILTFATSVERQAASAYLASVPRFKDRTLAKVAASILGVETTHVAILTYTVSQTTEPYKDFVT